MLNSAFDQTSAVTARCAQYTKLFVMVSQTLWRDQSIDDCYFDPMIYRQNTKHEFMGSTSKDCLIFEMLFIRKLKPKLSDSICGRLFT